VCVSRDCVHVIAEELRLQIVRARPAGVTDHAAVELREGARHAIGDVRMLHDTYQTSEASCVAAERRGEGVIDDVEVMSVRRNGRGRVEATVGRITYYYRTRPSATAISGIAEQHLFMVETKAT